MDLQQLQKIAIEHQKEMDALGVEIQELLKPMQQVLTALAENQMVKQEMDLLDADAVVYKQYGPVLIKKDVEEAQTNVNQRLSLLQKQHDSLEQKRQQLKNRQDELHNKLVAIRDQFQAAQRQAMAKMQQQQQAQAQAQAAQAQAQGQ